jgi:hypothetical protein
MSLSSQAKEPIDPECVGIPFAIDWVNWLAALGSGVALSTCAWELDSPLGGSGPGEISGSYAIVRVSGNHAAPGLYIAKCTVTASNGMTSDVRRLYLTVKNT